jgi:hypothetical protein
MTTRLTPSCFSSPDECSFEDVKTVVKNLANLMSDSRRLFLFYFAC